jgi:hypothetical protein
VSEAADHLLSIAENLAQLAAFAVGATVAGKVLAIRPSAFVEGLKPVALDDGRTRLWNPDLQPYEQTVLLTEGVPDELGLRHQAGKTFLPLEGRNYEVAADTENDTYHVRHPLRPDAYRPHLNHNGAGAWAHEVERPMEWQGAQLFRRLGHSVAEFSDATARRILAVSGIDEAMLRRMHVHSQRPPALLDDTIRRFKLDQRIQLFKTQMASPDPAVYAKADVQLQLQLLKTQKVELPEGRLRDGDVIETVLEVVPEREQKLLLGLSASPGDALPGRRVRTALLRNRMAGWAQEHRTSLFTSLEELFESGADQNTQQIRRIFPGLPKTIAQELWRHASAADRLQMQRLPGLPRSMAHEALVYLREVRLSRACEGLYLDSVAGPDTDILALHMLETLSGWSPEIRIEVRDSRFDGALLDSIGRPEAAVRKVLVRQQSQYQTHDSGGQHLHGLDDLYGSVMHALTDSQRQALGLPHVGQGAGLKQAVRRLSLPARSQLRVLFGQPPLEPGARSPMGLAIGRSGYLFGGGDFVPEPVHSIEHRLRALFPALSEEELAALRRQRLIGDPLLAVARLENEYVTLTNELEVWSADVPSRHPLTGAVLMDDEMVIQRQRRESFAQELRDNWSRKLTASNGFTPTTLEFNLEIVGELPEISADFSHVRELSLSTVSSHLRGHVFLSSFSGVQYLSLSGFVLESFPSEIYQMRELVTLTLNGCGIGLTEITVEGLAHMEGLTLLDLSNNPLGLPPELTYMKHLDSLYLANTGLATFPAGMFDLEKLALVDFTFNQVETLPDELFEVPDTRQVNYKFLDNPLSEASLLRVAEYDATTGLDRKILIQVDSEEEPVADWDTDESGIESGDD